MSDLTQILNNAESYRKSKDIDFSSLRTGYRTYEIEISHDDEGYYFDIYQIDRVEGDSFSVRNTAMMPILIVHSRRVNRQ